MLIRSLLVRKGGSLVTLGGQTYHFIPAAQYPGSPHLADVTNEAHIHRLLSITEGYRLFIPPADSATAAPTTTATAAPTIASMSADILAQTKSSAPAADASSAKTTKATATKAAKAAAASAAAAPTTTATATTDADKEAQAAAVSDYFAKFGKQPDPSMTTEQIAAAVASGKAE